MVLDHSKLPASSCCADFRWPAGDEGSLLELIWKRTSTLQVK
jgi:hypothetical protein